MLPSSPRTPTRRATARVRTPCSGKHTPLGLRDAKSKLGSTPPKSSPITFDKTSKPACLAKAVKHQHKRSPSTTRDEYAGEAPAPQPPNAVLGDALALAFDTDPFL